MSARSTTAIVIACGLLSVGSAHAQSAQPWSVQASFLGASQKIGDNAIAGSGFEGQVRYTTAGLWSFGLGYQYTRHVSGADEIDISGVFLEPRLTIDVGSDRIAPYLAGRVAFLHESLSLGAYPGSAFSSNGSAFGAGAGLLIRATKTINFDFGAAFVRQSFSDATSGSNTATLPAFTGYVAKGGVSIGFGSRR